jgi:hypothetical protein
VRLFIFFGEFKMKPSSKQEALLRRWKIPVPSTRQASFTLIEYILRGAGDEKSTVGERIVFIRQCYKKFVGAHVRIIRRRHPLHGKYGQVRYLKTRPQQELETLRSAHRGRVPYPLVAIVSLPDCGDRMRQVALSELKIINPADQRLLFT